MIKETLCKALHGVWALEILFGKKPFPPLLFNFYLYAQGKGRPATVKERGAKDKDH